MKMFLQQRGFKLRYRGSDERGQIVILDFVLQDTCLHAGQIQEIGDHGGKALAALEIQLQKTLLLRIQKAALLLRVASNLTLKDFQP